MLRWARLRGEDMGYEGMFLKTWALGLVLTWYADGPTDYYYH